MDSRAVLTALLAYGREERRLGEGTGSYGAVDAALDVLCAKLWPTRDVRPLLEQEAEAMQRKVAG